ncbi:peptidoglycan-binding domain-containing protein [Ruegeria sp. HKCCD7255]|uniref:peptidoglycan-binding domain-containing protein n=1 Tax=Ruegeria sp. HKCCD7255 TaxID=2683004 RepID=UPI001489CD4E|nr:peptidoglycan-binding domain-containing protein [Ruegeria sp. HKCCD7255]
MCTKVLAAKCLALSIIAPSVAAQDSNQGIKTLYNLLSIEALAFDIQSTDETEGSVRNELIVATGGTINRYSLDGTSAPLQSFTKDMIVSDVKVSPSGLIFSAGQKFDADKFRLEGGRIVGYRRAEDGSLLDFNVYGVPDTIVGQSSNGQVSISEQFTSVAFDGAAWAYFASPVDFDVLVWPDAYVDAELPDGTERPSISLKCSTSSQFSIAELSGSFVYLSSTTRGAQIEVGNLEQALDAAVDFRPRCITPSDDISNTGGIPGFEYVRHKVINVPNQDGTGSHKTQLLVLEPNAGTLLLYDFVELEDAVRIRKSGVPPINLKELAIGEDKQLRFNLLDATSDGSMIFVSGLSMEHVLRFSIADGNFREALPMRVHRPIKRLELRDDGEFAAVGVGESFHGGDVYLHVMTAQYMNNLFVLKKNVERPLAVIDKRDDNLKSIQRGLNKFGYDAGDVDGIAGLKTFLAIDSFLEGLVESGELEGSADKDPKQELKAEILTFFPTSLSQSQALAAN